MGHHYGNVVVDEDISSNNSASPNNHGVLNDNVENGFYSQSNNTANELATSAQPTVQQ